MTLREKIGHLYRRFTFGATVADLDRGEKEGVDKTIERLVDYDAIPAGPEASPFEFMWREKEEPDLNTYRMRCWWVHRMLTSERPQQEKLALFWHSYFAVGDDKVEDGPMMLAYLQTLRSRTNGKFLDLLRAVSQDPAMMRYLDMQRSIRGNPNENFGREVMELFTLGIDGGYTETDVKEVSRALTGWGYVHLFYEMPGSTELKVKRWLNEGTPFSSFTHMPAMHDPTPKTVLGKTANYDGEAVLRLLADQPATHRRLALRMWQFYGMETPPDKAVERTAKALKNGDIKAGLRSVARAPEFWSKECVRSLPRSPADFVVGTARQSGVGEGLKALRPAASTAETRIPGKIFDELGYSGYRMERMGLNLLVPPDVSGWKWDRSWITPATMAERYQYQGQFHWHEDKIAAGAKTPLDYVKSKSPKERIDVARAIAELHDLPLSPDELATASKAGGNIELKENWDWVHTYTQMLRVMLASPRSNLV